MATIDPAVWRRAQPMLDRLLDLPVESRAAFLTTIGRSDPDVAATLASLTRSGSAGITALLDEMSRSVSERQDLHGQQVGRYTIVGRLGEGGMGTVWRARRSDGTYEGEAAVKLLHTTALGAARVDRFRREASLLASLSHPHIAGLLDAGITPAGQPYLVLELVDGIPIDRFCAEHQLPIAARLELVRQVCAAVSRAHAALVVHRDIKPSNILVTPEGTAKLLDFGIAQLAQSEELGTADTVTQALTPECAAPEQIRREPATTACDVYAMGVLLHRLLAGDHPTGIGCRTGGEFLQATLERTPVRLGDAVVPSAGRTVEAADAHARSMGLVPSALRRRLKGDLEYIVALALRKDPAARYLTIGALAEDLGRYIRHEPVRARPASAGYRFRRFARRNRVAVVVATLMTLFLAGGLAITWRQNVELARQRDDARLQRAQAQYQLRRATASSNFMQAFLSTVPASGNGLRLEDLLDNARSLLATGYSGDTRFRARMLLELSDQYRLRDLAQDEKDLVHEALGLAIASGDDDLTAQAECRLALLPGEADSVLLARAEARLARSRAIDTRTSVYCHLAAARRIGRYDPQAAETRVRLAIRVAELGGDTVSQAAALALGRLRGRLLAANAGRSREGLAVARREVGLLGALGLAATRQAIQAKLGVAYALSRLGEVQAAAAVSAEVDSFAPRVDQVLRDNIYLTSARIALRRGRFAPYVRAAMLERAAAQGEGLALHVQFLSAGLAVVLSDSGAIVAARAALDRASTGASSELAARDARMLQAIVGVAKGALADAEGRYGDAVLLYRNEAALASPDAIFSDEHLTYRAARSALANRDAPLADSLGVRILQLLREAQHDEFRSADVGLALLLRARSRLILRDSVAAEALAQAAVMPLANGFGRDHQDTRAAVLLLDSLRLARRDG